MLRVYDSFMDFLGNVGGVFEILMSIFMILLTIHSGIEMELYLVNQIALGDTADEE